MKWTFRCAAFKILSVASLTLVFSVAAFGQRTALKPGWNLFSPAQDVELGRKVSQDAERQLPMLNQRRVDDYLDRLGKRLAAYAPGEKYPYQFKCVNDASINAFALPGGFIYIHRGLIEAADNEAELAGVIGHEIGHVALRHGTNQASKQQLYQAPLAVFGGIMGNDSMAGALAQIGGAFAVTICSSTRATTGRRRTSSEPDPTTRVRSACHGCLFEKLGTGNRGTDFSAATPSRQPDRGIEQEISRLGRVQRTAGDSRSSGQALPAFTSRRPCRSGAAIGQPAPGRGRRRGPSALQPAEELR